VGATALPGSAGQGGGDRVHEARVGVRGHEAHALKAASDETPEEGEPGGAVLLRDDIEAERLAVAVTIDSDRVHDADVDGPAALAALHDQGVEDQVRVGAFRERAGAEILDDLVERLRQPRDLTPRHPLDAELLHELLHPLVETPAR
jgi:hypothetical protein